MPRWEKLWGAVRAPRRLEWRERDEIDEVLRSGRDTVKRYAALRSEDDKEDFSYDGILLAHAGHLLGVEDDPDDDDDDLQTNEDRLLSLPEARFCLPDDVARSLELVWGRRTTRDCCGASWPEVEAELKQVLVLFTSVLRGGAFSVWSCLRKVTVGLPCDLLRSLSLTDVPGFENEMFRDEQIRGAVSDVDVVINVDGEADVNFDVDVNFNVVEPERSESKQREAKRSEAERNRADWSGAGRSRTEQSGA